MLHKTKSYKLLKSIEGADTRDSTAMKVKLAWATLHSLCHSERVAYRQNANVWLGDLLMSEISQGINASILSNLRSLQQKISHAGIQDSSIASDVPLSIWLFCGLLKSKHNYIRWGFLVVLERLLMRCKFLLDENEMQHSDGGDHVYRDTRLEKANSVIDIMSTALSLVFQINETDRINILKVIL